MRVCLPTILGPKHFAFLFFRIQAKYSLSCNTNAQCSYDHYDEDGWVQVQIIIFGMGLTVRLKYKCYVPLPF